MTELNYQSSESRLLLKTALYYIHKLFKSIRNVAV